MSNPNSAERARPWIAAGCFALALLLVIAVSKVATMAWDSILEQSMKEQFAKADEAKQKLNRLIATELPVDANRSQVQAWFDKHRVQHEYFNDTTGDSRNNDTMAMLAGLRDEDLSGMERGSVHGSGPDNEVGYFAGVRITIYFFFDKHGKVVGHYVDCMVECL